jgi:predicted permease
LLLRTFLDLRSAPLGFAPENVLTFNVALSDVHYQSPASETAFYRDLSQRILALPGVTATGASSLLPLTPGDYIDGFFRVGHPEDVVPNVPRSRLQNVTPGYLEALGVRLVAGRLIAESDVEGGALVAVVNEELQRQYFPDGAVGRLISFHGANREIVGVVSDKRHRGLRERPRADLYIPRAQADWPRWFSWVAVRHRGPVDPLMSAIRAAVRDVDPRVSVDGVGTLTDRVDRTLAPDRFRAMLVGALAAVALLLAVVGIYGLVAYAVARDARDTAIRIALGATSSRTIGAVLRRVLLLTSLGIAAGLGLALAGQSLLASFVAGVTVRDPLTMGVVAAGLLGVSVAAAAGPAFRATRVNLPAILRGN